MGDSFILNMPVKDVILNFKWDNEGKYLFKGGSKRKQYRRTQ